MASPKVDKYLYNQFNYLGNEAYGIMGMRMQLEGATPPTEEASDPSLNENAETASEKIIADNVNNQQSRINRHVDAMPKLRHQPSTSPGRVAFSAKLRTGLTKLGVSSAGVDKLGSFGRRMQKLGNRASRNIGAAVEHLDDAFNQFALNSADLTKIAEIEQALIRRAASQPEYAKVTQYVSKVKDFYDFCREGKYWGFEKGPVIMAAMGYYEIPFPQEGGKNKWFQYQTGAAARDPNYYDKN